MFQDYELRFPRLTKIYRAAERGWKDAVTLQKLHNIACESIGRDKSGKDIRDWSSGLWGRHVSPGIKSTPKRKAASNLWELKLSSDCHSKRLKVDNNCSTHESRENITKTPPRKLSVEPLASRTNIFDRGSQLNTPGSALRSMKSYLNTPPENKRSPTVQTFSSPTKSPQLVDVRSSIPQECSTSIKSSQGMAFLENALIWVAKPRAGEGPPYSSHQSWVRTLPRRQRLHSVESLFFGCGWSKDCIGSSWVERGVIFIDASNDEGRKWRTYVLEVAEEQRRSLPNGQTRKPIWIFDLETWSFSVPDVDGTALHRLD
jgi:DNA ligase-4